VLHLRLIIVSVGGDVPIDSETLLMIDFMNLKMSAQSFKDAHRDSVCIHIFIGVSAYTCMSICICIVLRNIHSNILRICV
jgi:hypothetical protein